MSPTRSCRLVLSENAKRVLERRYLIKNKEGCPAETPEEMFRRVARHIASAEKKFNATDAQQAEWEEKFFDAMTRLDFLPNSPTLMNAGRELGQLSACFVLPVDDSMESIFEAIKNTALIHKSGGGTGFSFSRLRPKNSIVRSTSGVASGPVSFLKVFNSATEAVKQGGTRRGANMGILRVDHPDIEEFITCKQNEKDITNFNISVAVTNDFMERVKTDDEYCLMNPQTKKVEGRRRAQEVFDRMVENAWKNGDPGIIFIDRVNQDNPTPRLGEIEATNPCGEQPLLPYESCNLGSINLAHMVTSERIDYGRLARVVKEAVRFLDNVIEVNKYPLPQIEEMVHGNRKIGLGVMGFADMLYQLRIPYDSEEGNKIAKEVMGFIYEEAMRASAELAEERGVFPNFEHSVYNIPGGPKLRNATVITIAPTGTISMIADCSSGIEPLFSLVFTKTVMDGTDLYYVNTAFEKCARDRGFYSEELMRRIAQDGSIQGIAEIPEEIKKVFVVARDITPYWHVKMQATFQEYTDDAVSKTINFPNSATKEEVREAYLAAYDMGCKGITIYRDGSREEQVLTVGIKKTGGASGEMQGLQEDHDKETHVFRRRPRPEVIHGTTTKIGTGCGSLYVTINEDEQRNPFEMFSQMGKAGGCAASQLEAIGRLVSLALRSGIPLEAIMEQLRGIRCPEPTWLRGLRIFSCADAIARVIEKRLNAEGAEVPKIEERHSPHTMHEEELMPVKGPRGGANVIGVCPDCGAALWHEEGCAVCHACGYSKCS
ncbi:MAG: vitamin B12-dependent ribonucleotide reductase [Candidatus Omnitrophica bacterium]|nr:vitamin B12-dependent ribonucleotide reductase [Candidatus Omnitrophota bacterium]